jgi:hypothetical protein
VAIGPFDGLPALLAHARTLVGARTASLQDNVLFCIQGEGAGNCAPFPALLYCFSTVDLFGALYAGHARPGGTARNAEAYMRDVMHYTTEQARLLQRVFRHKLVHLATPMPLAAYGGRAHLMAVLAFSDRAASTSISTARRLARACVRRPSGFCRRTMSSTSASRCSRRTSPLPRRSSRTDTSRASNGSRCSRPTSRARSCRCTIRPDRSTTRPVVRIRCARWQAPRGAGEPARPARPSRPPRRG